MTYEENARPTFLDSLILPLFLAVSLWTIHIITFVLDINLSFLGILPKSAFGLIGILTAPFIHGDFQHLISNTLPLVFLSWTIVYFYKEVAYKAIGLIYILTGIMVWAFARDVYHIGASGVVYGLVAFVFWSGLFIKDVRAIVLALVVTVLYSGMFFGVLPNQEGISWESHLFGALVGIAVAFIIKSEIEPERKYDDWEEDDDENKKYFLPPDTFEKTKLERAREEEWDWESDVS
ncbi:MAG: membrane associated rhomboid family serine protease [Saprospiraceae bacterium]|jgi:membrane associated rhomboid family serine protease